jgi:DNA-directed RNA polymerase specialized sigma24 family protein
MRDERGFAGFVAERSAALRRQALLLVGDPERAGALAGRALADTGRRWDGLVAAGGADAAEEHARTILARAALRRPARGRRPVAAPAPAADSHSVVPSGEAPAAAADGTREAGDSGGGLAVVQLPSARRAARVGLRTPAGSAGAGEAESGAGAGVEDAEAVWRALASLPPRRRAVLVLRYDEGLDDPSIAARLGVGAGAVATDGEAGIAALRSILRRRGRPEDLLGPALAARTAPPAPSPVTASEASVRVRPRRRRLRRLVVGGVAAAVVAGAAVVVVPLVARDGGPPLPLSAASRPGQLAWPARGPLTGDRDLLRAAAGAWQADPPSSDPPTDVAVLYAGQPDGVPVVVLQGVARGGQPWVAQVTGGAGAARVERSAPIGAAAPLLAIPVDADRVRLLGPPGATLRARMTDLGPTEVLPPLPLDGDGLSEPVAPPPAGLPIVVVGGGDDSPAILGSGTAAAGQLAAAAKGTVEIAAGTLALGSSAEPRPSWYSDGELLAARLGGAVTLAAAGPRLSSRLAVGRDVKPVDAMSYELRRTGQVFLGTVVRRAGAPICVDAVELVPPASSEPAPVPPSARRCMPRGGRDGVVHVITDAATGSVRIRLQPGARGQRPEVFRLARATPGARAAGSGFAALVSVRNMPTGSSVVDVLDGSGRVVRRLRLPLLRPAR